MNAKPYTDGMHAFVTEVLRDIGPRESCSENERRLGARLATEWHGLGHLVRTEPFTCHPKAFLGFIPFSALLYLAATVTYWFAPLFCVVFAGVACAAIFFELLRYREFVDPLFPREEGENVVAVIPPRGEVRQRVIVSAHQDSAYEFNLWFLLKSAALPLMVISLAAPLLPLAGGLAKLFAGPRAAPVLDTIGYVCMALYPIVGLNLFFHTYSVVPGAMDDLAGIAVLVGLGRALAEQDGEEASRPEHTEIVLLAAAAEEAGLRGAKRYVEQHRDELHAIPTHGLFVDGVYDERHLTVIRRELTTGTRHDPRLVELARRAADKRERPLKEGIIPFGGTDGAAFAVAGVSTVALLCQDISRLVPNYHTRRDVLKHVRPQSLEVMLQLIADMIAEIDGGALNTN